MGIDSIPWSVTSALESSLPATIHQMLIPMLEQKFEGLRSQIEEKALVQRPEKIERYELGDSERAKYSNLDRRKSSRSKEQPYTWWFIRTPIGSISYTRYAVRAHNEISSSEFRLAFIPHPLLFGRAGFINGVWDPVSSRSLTDLNFHFCTVLSDDSPLFKACQAGDVGTMKFLFQNKQASLTAVNTEGENLLLVRALDSGASPRPDR